MGGKRVFISVGTTKFDKLCKIVLSEESLELFNSLGYDRLTFQVGNSKYEQPGHSKVDVEIYRFKESIIDDIKSADLVVSHAGMGTCLEVLDAGKPLLVVINTDLMDNHQVEIAERLHADGHLFYCTCETYLETLSSMDASRLKPFPKADPSRFFEHLDELMGFRS